jgi:hypothetical protein
VRQDQREIRQEIASQVAEMGEMSRMGIGSDPTSLCSSGPANAIKDFAPNGNYSRSSR